MTEEQKKKCEEIYNLHIDFPLKIRPIFLPKFGWVKIAMLLAEVFNKNITEEEAGEIFDNIFNNIGKMNCVKAKAILLPIGINPISQSNYKDIFWKIANYFDNGNKEANKINNINKINNVVENTAKEKIMSNNDELTLNLLILGQTGVGKSSLINALFGRKVAESRVGPPVPIEKGIKEYTTELDGKKVNLFDTEGIEVDKVPKFKEMIDKALKERRVDKDIKDWFHSVTYCIQAGGYKIQDFDIEIIKQFVDEGYNVIVALTKSDQIGKAKREEFIDKIKKEVKEKTKKDIMVITVSADPEQLDHMTEKPKPSGLEEYKAAILISWREIFINRIPVHIVKKLKEDIENVKKNAPRKGKDKELTNKIQEYFSNILNANTQKYVRESIEKYYKITADILASSKNINLSNKELDLNFHSEFDDDGTIEMFADAFRNLGDFEVGDRIKVILLAPLAIPLVILENFGKFLDFIGYIAFEKNEKIEKFIKDVSEEYTKKIGEEEFESEIRKIIINALNEIDKKIIKLN
ncbi:GTPase [Brachyspira aalborgi]|jgi:predicted GTPase|uniref:Septin-type G domain-containing protein n=1 Tax=Brachyspira aalborgi TaxID=29522 RepID=A0ABY3K5X7_9SPIR|nr:GTPase domain-containing protein [Brachyspira aalborgi]TXJ30637.1 hypothetical protein EPJ71_11865 [Brachyspira aalborgi]TXJ45132.1 hypothetical protein EPJ65_01975 [Brachyspira aalborgi]